MTTKIGTNWVNTGFLSGSVLQVAGDHKYHPECFQCHNCDTFIEDGQTYALVERSRLFWWGNDSYLYENQAVSAVLKGGGGGGGQSIGGVFFPPFKIF